MIGGGLRAAIAMAVEALALRLECPLSDSELAQPALVFAPHPDDETLGCGGLMALKRAQGAAVTVVFLTDGRTSHARFIAADDLAARRRSEAWAACAVLGVSEADVVFFDFPDGELAAHVSDAADRIADLLRAIPGRQLLAPYHGDTTPDHRATLSAVLGAVERLDTGPSLTLLEYPVWFWHHWPWVAPPVRRRLHLFGQVAHGVVAAVRRLVELRVLVVIESVLAIKKAALAAHGTQTVRPLETTDWPVLADVADGQWLPMFFTGREHYRRRRLSAGVRSR